MLETLNVRLRYTPTWGADKKGTTACLYFGITGHDVLEEFVPKSVMETMKVLDANDRVMLVRDKGVIIDVIPLGKTAERLGR